MSRWIPSVYRILTPSTESILEPACPLTGNGCFRPQALAPGDREAIVPHHLHTSRVQKAVKAATRRTARPTCSSTVSSVDPRTLRTYRIVMNGSEKCLLSSGGRISPCDCLESGCSRDDSAVTQLYPSVTPPLVLNDAEITVLPAILLASHGAQKVDGTSSSARPRAAPEARPRTIMR